MAMWPPRGPPARARAVARFRADVGQARGSRAAEPTLLRHDQQAYLAGRITDAVCGRGLRTEPEIRTDAPRSVQIMEIGIDATGIAAIRPFWKALLGYAGEAGADGPGDPLVDPVGQGPAIWFQQMDQPRTERNRIHFDICVPHDEAPRRIAAALAAGGRMLPATRAPAFWVLADIEGNEACVTTWQGRDG